MHTTSHAKSIVLAPFLFSIIDKDMEPKMYIRLSHEVSSSLGENYYENFRAGIYSAVTKIGVKEKLGN